MEKTIFILEQIYRMSQIPIYYTSSKTAEALLSLGYTAEENPFIADEALHTGILSKLSALLNPILDLEEEILYGACFDPDGHIIILGPVSMGQLSEGHLKHYTYQHKIKAESFYIIPRTMEQLCAALASIIFTLTGECLDKMALLETIDIPASPKDKSDARYRIDPPMEGVRFNYSSELDFTKSIKNGCLEEIQTRINRNASLFPHASVGKLAQSSFKQNEYMACTALALASRAAIDGGLNAFVAYSMSDWYLQRLERCKNIPAIHQLIGEFNRAYAQQVRKANEERSNLSYVEQCKTYIVNHLTQKFTVEDIAEYLKINRSYLSRQFALSEKMGIGQYTKQKRLEAAANMLKFSDESILTISDYFCFSSQSHFGRAFKEYAQMTPQAYRKKYQIIDISSS